MTLDSVGDGDPVWLSGAGLISAVLALRASGHLDESGLMKEEGPLAPAFSRVEDVLAIRLGGPDDAPIFLTQKDIRAFQTAKSAIAAGIRSVLSSAKFKPKKISSLIITGALGSGIPLEDLVEIGIVPADLLPVAKQVDQAALVGAATLAMAPSLLDEATRITSEARHVELGNDPRFSEMFMESVVLAPFTIRDGF